MRVCGQVPGMGSQEGKSLEVGLTLDGKSVRRPVWLQQGTQRAVHGQL